jgi:hypothetical protein
MIFEVSKPRPHWSSYARRMLAKPRKQRKTVMSLLVHCHVLLMFHLKLICYITDAEPESQDDEESDPDNDCPPPRNELKVKPSFLLS